MDFKCKICGENDKSSIEFLGNKICKNCLNKITHTDTDTILHYEYYKSSIKEMWLDYISS